MLLGWVRTGFPQTVTDLGEILVFDWEQSDRHADYIVAQLPFSEKFRFV
jgi:hypothetical protein